LSCVVLVYQALALDSQATREQSGHGDGFCTTTWCRNSGRACSTWSCDSWALQYIGVWANLVQSNSMLHCRIAAVGTELRLTDGTAERQNIGEEREITSYST
jgi:hypothetical protein